MYCLDRSAEPSQEFQKAKYEIAKDFGGSMDYRRVDVTDASGLDDVIAEVASKHSRLDGLIAGAGVQNVTPALDYPPEKIGEVRSIVLQRPCSLLTVCR